MSLRSDHVNYLIWRCGIRYLQEYGYGRAAVQFMRDWGHADPQDLPFAHMVRPHALLSMLQDGLTYDRLSSSIEGLDRRYRFVQEQMTLSHIAAASHPTLNQDAVHKNTVVEDNPTNTVISGTHHHLHSHARIADELEDRMEVEFADQEAGSQPSHARNAKPVRLESTLITGNSVGIQSERPSDLMLAKTSCEISISGSQFDHVTWDLQNRSSIVAGGGTLCHRWFIPSASTTGAIARNPQAEELVSRTKPYLVTSLTRSLRTNTVALALEEGDYFNYEASGLFVSRFGDEVQPICKGLDPLVVLRWHPQSDLLVGASSRSPSNLRLWDAKDGALLDIKPIETTVMDLEWATGNYMIVAGNNLLDIYNVQQEITHLKSLTTSCAWEKIKYSENMKMAACMTNCDGQIGMFDLETFHLKVFIAHEERVTDLVWQPSQTVKAETSFVSLLVTASVDGILKVWNVLDTGAPAYTLHMGYGVPAMTAAFSPDGALLAAAGDKKIVIWKADRGGRPVASWTSSDRLVNGHLDHGEDDHDPEPGLLCHNNLSWNCDGTSIAYAAESKMTIIEITPCVR